MMVIETGDLHTVAIITGILFYFSGISYNIDRGGELSHYESTNVTDSIPVFVSSLLKI